MNGQSSPNFTFVFLEVFAMREVPTITLSIMTTISSFVVAENDHLFQMDFSVYVGHDICFFMGFKSGLVAQEETVPVRLLSKERRRPKRSFGISFHEKAHGGKEKKPLIPTEPHFDFER